MSEPYWTPLGDAQADVLTAQLYVTAAGNDLNDGLSWDSAKRQIDAAYGALPAGGGTILVGPGTYTPFTLDDAKARVEVRAIGAASIAVGAGQVGVAINGSGAGGSPLVGPLVEGFVIDGTAGGGETGTATGVQFFGMTRATVRRLRIANCLVGINFVNDVSRFTERNSVENTLINNCGRGIRFIRAAAGHTSFSYNRFYNVGVDNCPTIAWDLGSQSDASCDLFGSSFEGCTCWLQDASAVGVAVDCNMLGVIGQIDVEWQAGAGAVGWDVMARATNLDKADLESVLIGNWTGATKIRCAAGKTIRFVAPYQDRDEARARGEGIGGQTFDRSGGVQAATALTAGTISAGLVPLRRGDVVANIAVVMSALGTGVTLAKCGLYTKAGVLVASSANQFNDFNTGTVPRAVGFAMTTPYVVQDDDVFFICVLSVGGTPPSLIRGVNLGAAAVAIGSGQLPHAQLGAGGQTDLPANASRNATGTAFWLAWS